MLSFAKVGGPPANWAKLRIIDVAAEEAFGVVIEMRGVLEVDAVEGWLDRHQYGADGKLVCRDGELVLERRHGSFRIEEID